MNWKDVRERAMWTFIEAVAGTLVAFITLIAAVWVESGTFMFPVAAFVALAAGIAGAVGSAISVIKEYAKYRRSLNTKQVQ